jgi:hypothetical protein
MRRAGRDCQRARRAGDSQARDGAEQDEGRGRKYFGLSRFMSFLSTPAFGGQASQRFWSHV